MFSFGVLGFTAPWLLVGLLALPVLWILLRAVPPAPVRRRFPGIILLLGLNDEENETDKTPWWLLLLRCLAVAAAIIAFAGPVLNPENREAGTGPLLILLDATWADAATWEAKTNRIERALSDAAADGRTVAIASLNRPQIEGLQFQSAGTLVARLPSFQPAAWTPDESAHEAFASAIADEAGFDTIWISDGLDRPGRNAVLSELERHGAVQVFQSPRSVVGIRPIRFEDGLINLTIVRSGAEIPAEATISARGKDPAGVERSLATATANFESGATEANIKLSLPAELRNRISRFELVNSRTAGGVTLADDALKRREIALLAGRSDQEGLELLSPLHYLNQALQPTADLLDGALDEVLPANPDVIILADFASFSESESQALLDWVEAGGFLVRFAGPRMAASDISREDLDPLMPVRLRAGGRTVGGAMSWGEPKSLRAFDASSPFFGLPIPDDVSVTSQVMAQPDPELAQRVVATLTDGTPLITRRDVGDGQVILFHVTANAEWSTLPLSGLFVQMLERLAISTRPSRPTAEDLGGTIWVPRLVLSAFGELEDAGDLPGVTGERLAEASIGRDLRPGLYVGEDRQLALNVLNDETVLTPMDWPARIPVEGLATTQETRLKGLVLAIAVALLMLDVIASLWLGGRLRRLQGSMAAIAVLLVFPTFFTTPASAQQPDEASAVSLASEVVLAHVLTGDQRLDDVAVAGLRGLSDRLFRRTSIEPAAPVSVDLESDELSFFPFLYWPVSADQPIPSEDAYAKLNRYLRSGGMIMFDTRDAGVAAGGRSTPESRMLQTLARPLDIPPLEPVPIDHVLTRSFYLLQDFPGRHNSRSVWVEAAPADAVQVEGMPFRNLNDGVTPVIIGGNDWASAWAIDGTGQSLFPVGRGFTGERQREIAYRFGINLIMHVLTGNYKSDQVHVPALLDRLGQ